MSLASALVIYLTDYPAGQYSKSLERSKEKKVVKITKAVKTITKARKLRNIAKAVYLLAFLPFFYHPPCLSKKLHLDNKNLQQNLLFSFFYSFNQNTSITFILLIMSNKQEVQEKPLIILRNAEDYPI